MMKLTIDIPDIERLEYIALDTSVPLDEVIAEAAAKLSKKIELFIRKKAKDGSNDIDTISVPPLPR